MIIETYQVGDFLIEAYDHPSVNLSLPAQQTLIREFTPIADDGFDKHDFEEAVVRRHFLSTSTTIVIRERSGQVAGFAGSSLLDIDEDKIIYLQGGTIARSCRARNLYRIAIGARILAEVRKIDKHYIDNGRVLIAGRTQNPITYKLLHRKLGFFPHPDGYIHNGIKNKAKKVAEIIYSNFSDFQSSEGCMFDTDSFVLRRTFGSISGGKESGYCLYDNDIPFCNDDDAINQYMETHIDWHNGDCLLMMGYYNKQDVLNLFHGHKIEFSPSLAA